MYFACVYAYNYLRLAHVIILTVASLNKRINTTVE